MAWQGSRASPKPGSKLTTACERADDDPTPVALRSQAAALIDGKARVPNSWYQVGSRIDHGQGYLRCHRVTAILTAMTSTVPHMDTTQRTLHTHVA